MVSAEASLPPGRQSVAALRAAACSAVSRMRVASFGYWRSVEDIFNAQPPSTRRGALRAARRSTRSGERSGATAADSTHRRRGMGDKEPSTGSSRTNPPSPGSHMERSSPGLASASARVVTTECSESENYLSGWWLPSSSAPVWPLAERVVPVTPHISRTAASDAPGARVHRRRAEAVTAEKSIRTERSTVAQPVTAGQPAIPTTAGPSSSDW